MCCLLVCDSHAVIVDQTMYIYGCIGLDPTTATLVSGGIESEAEQVFILFGFSCIVNI